MPKDSQPWSSKKARMGEVQRPDPHYPGESEPEPQREGRSPFESRRIENNPYRRKPPVMC